MKRRIPILPTVRMKTKNNKWRRKPIHWELPGYDEVSEIMRLAQFSEEGLNAARRILTQLAHKALKERDAVDHYKLYQLALEDIGENFNHQHRYAKYERNSAWMLECIKKAKSKGWTYLGKEGDMHRVSPNGDIICHVTDYGLETLRPLV